MLTILLIWTALIVVMLAAFRVLIRTNSCL